jgi:phage terminase large subunit-like protein
VWLTIVLAIVSAFAGASAATASAKAAIVAVDYRPETCAYCGKPTWCELRANNKWQCRGCKVVRYFQHFLYPPIGYSLLPWAADQVLRPLYGTVNPENGLRQYRRAFISMGKQNGKSFLTGGLPIYHLDCEDEPDPEVYGAAAAKDQAGIVFKATAKLIRANAHLMQRFKIIDSQKRIIRRDNRATYEVLSADGDVRDGVRGSLLIRDEIHRWKTAKAETLRDVLTKGQISRREPLDIQATTAGAEYESPLWFAEYEFAKLVQKDPSLAPDYFVAIWEADAKRVEEDPDYWTSREARVAANPSHEDLGGHLLDTAIVVELNKAKANAAERSKYLRYHLNVPIKTHEDPVIDVPKWQACGGNIDLRTWPEYDFEFLMLKWGLKGRPCFPGVDASWTTDLSSVVFTFPPFDDVPEWTVLPFFWMPQEQVAKLERVCRVPFATWIKQGFITATEGNAIDLRSLVDRIRWGAQVFDVREVAFDRANFRSQGSELNETGITAREVPQGYLELGFATKFLLSAYPDRKIRHGNNPVLNWMAACLQLKYDEKDNCQPTKPERLKSSKRIDGMQAIVTALNRALTAEEKTISYSGLRTVG